MNTKMEDNWSYSGLELLLYHRFLNKKDEINDVIEDNWSNGGGEAAQKLPILI